MDDGTAISDRQSPAVPRRRGPASVLIRARAEREGVGGGDRGEPPATRLGRREADDPTVEGRLISPVRRS